MTAPSTSTAPVVHDDDLEDLEDIGGAETAEGVRVTRDLPPKPQNPILSSANYLSVD